MQNDQNNDMAYTLPQERPMQNNPNQPMPESPMGSQGETTTHQHPNEELQPEKAETQNNVSELDHEDRGDTKPTDDMVEGKNSTPTMGMNQSENMSEQQNTNSSTNTDDDMEATDKEDMEEGGDDSDEDTETEDMDGDEDEVADATLTAGGTGNDDMEDEEISDQEKLGGNKMGLNDTKQNEGGSL